MLGPTLRDATTLTLKIEGMHCAACVRRVTSALNSLTAVRVRQVSIGEAQVAYDPAVLKPQAVVDAVNAIGFHAEAVR